MERTIKGGRKKIRINAKEHKFFNGGLINYLLMQIQNNLQNFGFIL